MKVEKTLFAEFLRKVGLSGNSALEQAVLDFTDDGLKVKMLSPTEAVLVNGKLEKSNFNTYEAIGKIGIKDFPKFISFVNSFQDTLSIEKSKGVLTLKGKNRKINIPDKDSEAIVSISDEDFESILEQKGDKLFKVAKDQIKFIVDNVKLVDSYKIRLKSDKENVGLKTESENVLHEKLDIKTENKFDVLLGHYFIDVLDILKQDIEMSIEEDKPIFIDSNNVQYILTTL